MSDNWISIEDNLPKIGHIIEIKTEKPLSIMNATFTIINWCSENSNYHVNHKHTDVFVFKGLIGDYINNVTHWRPIKEKRPDFGKLRNGDMVEIVFFDYWIDDNGFHHKYNVKFKEVGIVNSIDDEKISLISGNHALSRYYNISKNNNILKITRINIEKQTFEEI